MKRQSRIFSMSAALGMCAAVGWSAPQAVAASGYSITATNVTMPSKGVGATHYTVSAIPLTGTLFVNCQYAGTNTTAKIPSCQYGPVVGPSPVTAGQTVKGTIYFYPYGAPVPVKMQRTARGPWTSLALAGVMVAGFSLRKRGRRAIALVLLATASLAGLAALSACGGSTNGMTSGTYAFTVSADNEASPKTPLGQGVSTTITVTVP